MSRGFTLVEMIVVLAIIVIVTMIALLGQSSFNRSLVLTDIAYTVAFSVREAQSLGISSRRFGTATDAGYGVHFSSGSATSYSVFADISPGKPGDTTGGGICPGHPNVAADNPEAKPGNCIQDSAAEIVRTYSINNGFRIKSFCGTVANGYSQSLRCNGSSSGVTLTGLDILYMRPNTQSVITGVHGSSSRVPLSDATIRIESPDGVSERCIYVSKVGQVSVHALGEIECP